MEGHSINVFRVQELYEKIQDCSLLQGVVNLTTIREFQRLLNEAKPCNKKEWFAYEFFEPVLLNEAQNKWNLRNAFKDMSPCLFLWMRPMEIISHFKLNDTIYVDPASEIFNCILDVHHKYEQGKKTERKSYSLPSSPVPKVVYPIINSENSATYKEKLTGVTKIEPARPWSDMTDEDDFRPNHQEHPILIEKEEVKPIETQKETKLSAEDLETFKNFNKMYEKMNEEVQKIKKLMDQFKF